MEEKFFNLLEKIYVELQETKKELKDEIKSTRNELTQRIDENSNDIKKLYFKIENDIEPKIDVLFEDREYVHSELRTIKEKVEKIEVTLDRHDVKLKVLEGKGK